MSLEYKIDREDDGAYDLSVNGFGIAKIYFDAPRCKSPLSDEEACGIIEAVKCMVESKHPASELKEEDYEPTLGEFFKFLKEMMEE